MNTFRVVRGLAKILCSTALTLSLAATNADAATGFTEAKGGTDHSMLSRFQGAILYKYGTINFDEVNVKLPDGRTETMEGKVFNYYYFGPKDRSDLEVYRSYKKALEQQHFKLLVACEKPSECTDKNLSDHARKWTGDSRTFKQGSQYMNNMDSNRPYRFLMARLTRPAGDITVILTVRGDAWIEQGFGSDYFLQVVESGPMKDGLVAVKADVLGKSLATDGKIALYGITFDTAKADIKPESKAQLDEMGKSLNQNKALKVYIVGHTDNQGALDANLALSQRRADAIVNALIKDYKVPATRLAAKGVASYAPVGSNATDAGRAQNRRVEMVLQ